MICIEGCGKTACLVALCKELGLHIEEWINPVEQVANMIFVLWAMVLRTNCCQQFFAMNQHFLNLLRGKVDFGERLDEKWMPGDSIQYQVSLSPLAFLIAGSRFLHITRNLLQSWGKKFDLDPHDFRARIANSRSG